jgi:hypothetical protein
LVTVTVRAPAAALADTLTVAFSSVELVKLVDSTVTPEPKDALAPLTKFLPLIATTCLLAPCPRELGLVDSTAGFDRTDAFFATLVAVHEFQTAVTLYSWLPGETPTSVQLVALVGFAALGHALLGAPPSRLT